MGVKVITTDGEKELFNTNLQALVDDGYILISADLTEDYSKKVNKEKFKSFMGFIHMHLRWLNNVS